MAVTEGEDDDQTGDSGMETGYASTQYLMRDFRPGIVHGLDPQFLSILTPVSTSLALKSLGSYYVCLSTSQC